jgi:hypothetical protein
VGLQDLGLGSLWLLVTLSSAGLVTFALIVSCFEDG